MRPGFVQALLTRLDALTAGQPRARWLVAFSGGLDSTALLHALAAIYDPENILAVHVDHGLHEDSAAWHERCRKTAAGLGVSWHGVSVAVDRRSGSGIEAAARAARYAVFESLLQQGDFLLTAHHRDDQAETLLLNLLRGSGTAGLAGIGENQPLGAGRMLRPLLATGRDEILQYAAQQGLQWIDDPSNEDRALDRNFLRHEVLPVLASRWPAASRKLARSAELMADANRLANGLASIDLSRCGTAGRIALDPLRALSAPRQANLLRHAARRCGLPSPPATCMDRLSRELFDARDDALPVIAWPGGECRRYRHELFLLPPLGAAPARPALQLLPGGAAVNLGPQGGSLSLSPVDTGGIGAGTAQAGLQVRYREGGEALRTAPHGNTRTLKNLLQEHGVFPWMRDRLPLLFAGDQLVAVADLWVAAECVAVPGFAVRWDGKPAIR